MNSVPDGSLMGLFSNETQPPEEIMRLASVTKQSTVMSLGPTLSRVDTNI